MLQSRTCEVANLTKPYNLSWGFVSFVRQGLIGSALTALVTQAWTIDWFVFLFMAVAVGMPMSMGKHINFC